MDTPIQYFFCKKMKVAQIFEDMRQILDNDALSKATEERPELPKRVTMPEMVVKIHDDITHD